MRDCDRCEEVEGEEANGSAAATKIRSAISMRRLFGERNGCEKGKTKCLLN